MRKIFALLALSGVLAAGNMATAAPIATYNKLTGEITIENDLGAPLANATILSPGGNLTDTAANLLDVTGAIKDDSELPFAFTYLSFPVGSFNVGNVVKGGYDGSDLSFEYRAASLLEPLIQGDLVIVDIPEPATFAMAGLGLIGFVAMRRRNG